VFALCVLYIYIDDFSSIRNFITYLLKFKKKKKKTEKKKKEKKEKRASARTRVLYIVSLVLSFSLFACVLMHDD
jgi:hypothetical protein